MSRLLSPLLAALLLLACRTPSATPKDPSVCVFCQIVAGTAPSRKVYEDSYVLAFWDIRPRAKVHLLVIPKQHVASLKELEELPTETRAALLSACVKVARGQGILNKGFRVISNTGRDANQSVFHLHFHVVGGEKLCGKTLSRRMRQSADTQSLSKPFLAHHTKSLFSTDESDWV